VREAFTYAFNYTNYLDEIVGNSIYGEQFGNGYCGAIINGLPYYVPETGLANVPSFNLTYATQLMKQSGEYSTAINLPIVATSGDTVTYAAAQMWGAALHQMDPNISVTVEYQEWPTMIAEQAVNADPMPIYYLGWIADYPYPSDFVNAFYLQSSIYPSAAGWSTSYLTSIGQSAESSQYGQLNTLITQADAATNATGAAQLYKEAEQAAINLYMYVYTQQPSSFWEVKPYMTGYSGIQSEENPMIGGAADSIFYWWVKG
jgi:ABC-type oligopeptide transport system substrate-binding subunit